MVGAFTMGAMYATVPDWQYDLENPKLRLLKKFIQISLRVAVNFWYT